MSAVLFSTIGDFAAHPYPREAALQESLDLCGEGADLQYCFCIRLEIQIGHMESLHRIV